MYSLMVVVVAAWFAAGAALQGLAMRGTALSVTYLIILVLEEVIAFGLGVAFFREGLSAPKLLGAALVLAGTFLLRSAMGKGTPSGTVFLRNQDTASCTAFSRRDIRKRRLEQSRIRGGTMKRSITLTVFVAVLGAAQQQFDLAADPRCCPRSMNLNSG